MIVKTKFVIPLLLICLSLFAQENYLNLGQSYFRLGQYPQASAAFKLYMNENKVEAQVLYALILTHLQQNEKELCLFYIEKYNNILNADPQVSRRLEGLQSRLLGMNDSKNLNRMTSGAVFIYQDSSLLEVEYRLLDDQVWFQSLHPNRPLEKADFENIKSVAFLESLSSFSQYSVFESETAVSTSDSILSNNANPNLETSALSNAQTVKEIIKSHSPSLYLSAGYGYTYDLNTSIDKEMQKDFARSIYEVEFKDLAIEEKTLSPAFTMRLGWLLSDHLQMSLAYATTGASSYFLGTNSVISDIPSPNSTNELISEYDYSEIQKHFIFWLNYSIPLEAISLDFGFGNSYSIYNINVDYRQYSPELSDATEDEISAYHQVFHPLSDYELGISYHLNVNSVLRMSVLAQYRRIIPESRSGIDASPYLFYEPMKRKNGDQFVIKNWKLYNMLEYRLLF